VREQSRTLREFRLRRVRQLDRQLLDVISEA
jgi:hypothetical protein